MTRAQRRQVQREVSHAFDWKPTLVARATDYIAQVRQSVTPLEVLVASIESAGAISDDFAAHVADHIRSLELWLAFAEELPELIRRAKVAEARIPRAS